MSRKESEGRHMGNPLPVTKMAPDENVSISTQKTVSKDDHAKKKGNKAFSRSIGVLAVSGAIIAGLSGAGFAYADQLAQDDANTIRQEIDELRGEDGILKDGTTFEQIDDVTSKADAFQAYGRYGIYDYAQEQRQRDYEELTATQEAERQATETVFDLFSDANTTADTLRDDVTSDDIDTANATISALHIGQKQRELTPYITKARELLRERDARNAINAVYSDGSLSNSATHDAIKQAKSLTESIEDADVKASIVKQCDDAESALTAREEAARQAEIARKAAIARSRSSSGSSSSSTSGSSATSSRSSSGSSGSSWTTSGSGQGSIDAGNLVEYYPDYYAAHNYTSYGKGIASASAGSIVTVNGRKVQIDGQVYGNYNTDTLESIRAKAGTSGPMFQTCTTGGGPIVVKYGHYVD